MDIILTTDEVAEMTGISKEDVLRLKRQHNIPGVSRIKVDSRPGRGGYQWSGRAIKEIVSRFNEEMMQPQEDETPPSTPGPGLPRTGTEG